MSLRIEGWKPPGAGEVEMAAVVALFRQGLAAETPPREKTAVAARALLNEWFAVPKTGMLIARGIGDKLDGLLILRNEPPAARILFVGAREPRKGIGTALVKSLREIVKAKGIHELRSSFGAKDERARAFFMKRLGFGERPATQEGRVEVGVGV